MSGVSVIGALLNGYTPLTDIVPAARIKAGDLPQGVSLPALAVTSVSGSDTNMLSTGAKRRVRERVQVTVLAPNYRTKASVMRLVKLACADKRGDIADVFEASVLTDGAGPDFMSDDATIWMSTQDFSVSFNEATI